MAEPTPSPPPSLGETDSQWGIVVTAIASAVITNLVVILRLLVRKFIVKSLSWDDLTIFLALVAKNFGTALVLVEIHYGFGRHRSEVSPESYAEYMRLSYLEWIQTFQTLMLTKISICLLLLRIVISRSFVYTLWIWIALLLVSNLILTFLWVAQCKPLWLAWESPLLPGSCFSATQLLQIIFSQAVVSAISDFILAAYPIFIIRRLRMATRRKVGLCILMGLGVFTGGLCIGRTVLNWQNVNDDSSWNVIPNWHLRAWEVTVGILVACLPALHPGYRFLYSRFCSVFGSTGGGLGPQGNEKSRRAAGAFTDHRRSSTALFVGTNKDPTALPPLPANTRRSDIRPMRATVDSDVNRDSLYLPIQYPWVAGAATEADLENQRVLSGDESEETIRGPKPKA